MGSQSQFISRTALRPFAGLLGFGSVNLLKPLIVSRSAGPRRGVFRIASDSVRKDVANYATPAAAKKGQQAQHEAGG
jgi:hypothetical protein